MTAHDWASLEFSHLQVGDTFDFISEDRVLNSFFKRCTKISQRKYRDEDGIEHRIGTTKCIVHNVKLH